MSISRSTARPAFFYGWIVVAIAFVTMAAAVSSRTGFSILFPALIDEFGWDRSVTAGAFSIGFVASTAFVPLVGAMMDRYGPRLVLPVGGLLIAVGYFAVTFVSGPLGLYGAFGILVVCGSMATSYIAHSMFLANWFSRRRGLATGIAFSGVGVGGMVIFPLMQWLIDDYGWRTACLAMAGFVVVLIVPLNAVFQRRDPEAMGLLPDGDAAPEADGGGEDGSSVRRRPRNVVVDADWVATDWTVARALATGRFWWLFTAFFCALFAWYAIQVHQTKFLVEAGFDQRFAASVLGLVGMFGIAGQIVLGGLSDRIGREESWTLALSGYVLCYGLLLVLERAPSPLLVYLMAAGQGLLGYGIASLFGPILSDVFAGPRFATIFGLFSLGGNLGAGGGPWVMGLIFDATGSYTAGFWICILASLISVVAVWMGAPRKVRVVAGKAR
jgi:sugar phosphate permease